MPRVEIAYTRSGYGTIELGLSTALLYTPRGETGFLFTFQDVTESRKNEREARTQQRLAAVGEMAAGIAHEIRNPLASMSGSIQILRQELPLTEEQSQLMDIVLRESDRLNETIRSFLAYARPQRLSASRMDVRQIVTDTATLLQNNAELIAGHSIETDVPEEPVWYVADPNQIRQVVWNLATNGLRAMPNGGTLRLSVACHEESDGAPGEMLIRVEDQGVGIAPEELDGIFQPFRGAFERGTGLGLAIVHRIVSDYGGEVHVTSRARHRHAGGGHAPAHRADNRRCTGDVELNMTTETQKGPPQTSVAPARVLVVDDERSMRELLSIVLRRDGYDVLIAEDGAAGLELLRRERVDILITDIRMPQMNGVDLLREAKRIAPDIVSIVMTAFASTETAVEALRLGAADYVTKSKDTAAELRVRVGRELERRRLQQENVLLKRALRTSHQFSNIIGTSSPMLALFQLIETIAPTNSTVLITGESGTGKELIARAIHVNSPRRERPFVAVNCGALSETLLDSELFGHMRGAFTGADSNKKGLIEVAEKGTIFLDEIGEMSPVVQVKLLRVLQERKFRRLGGTEEIDADIRILAATNRDLTKMVADGSFREDLFYRINVIPMRVPPLRERQGDIPLLAEHFVSRFAEQMGKPITGISGAALTPLTQYPWPGNIRELENAMERAVALERTPTILPDSLPEQLNQPPTDTAAPNPPAEAFPEAGFDLERHVQGIEREYIAEALRRAGGVKVKAAELLGMSFRSFRYYTKKYNLK